MQTSRVWEIEPCDEVEKAVDEEQVTYSTLLPVFLRIPFDLGMYVRVE
jgi:hypothetical protein